MIRSLLTALTLTFFLALSLLIFTNPPKIYAAPCSFSVSPITIPAHGSFSLTIDGRVGLTYTIRIDAEAQTTRTLNSSSQTFNDFDVDNLSLINPETDQFTLEVSYPVPRGGQSDCDPTSGVEVVVGTGVAATCNLSESRVTAGNSLRVNAYDLPDGDHPVSMTLNTGVPTPLGELERVGGTGRGEVHWTAEVTIPGGTTQGIYIIWVADGQGNRVRCSPNLLVQEPEEEDEGDGVVTEPYGPMTFFKDVLDPIKAFTSLGQIISKALPFIFGFAALIALLFLIWGGFRYMTAQGDEKMVTEARSTITSAIIGLVIIFAVVAIAQLLEIVFRINIIG